MWKHIHGQCGPSPTEARQGPASPHASSGSVISWPENKVVSCLWGMCQIRFLCNSPTLNKWTSWAKCFLRLGSDFCAHTQACSETTHTLAESGWANPACLSLCTIMHCVLCCLDTKRDSRGENIQPLDGWWGSSYGELHPSFVPLFFNRINWDLSIL